MAYTALNLITDVLLDMGVIADQETPTAAQSGGALVKLNDLIDSWNIDASKLYGATQYVLPLVANQGVYTIGLGGNLNVPRPNGFSSVAIRDNSASPANTFDYPISMLTNQQWADLPNKSITGTFPYAVWFNQANPLVSVYMSPIPTGSQYSLVFWDNNVIGQLALSTVMALAPGYNRALKYALFIELASSYQLQVPTTIANLAMTSKMGIDKQNLQINELKTTSRGWYDIVSNLGRHW
jgi:hypothetical protein